MEGAGGRGSSWPHSLAHWVRCQTCRVGQNRIYTPCMTVGLVISLPLLPCIHRIYMVLANPTHVDLVYFKFKNGK